VNIAHPTIDYQTMKIEKITICNLTSLEGEQVIDFTQEPLRSASLFAITGDTGAGKSTVLDAVCLALYNRAPRFDGVERANAEDVKSIENRAQAIQAGDVRGILRRGCKEGYAKVVFATLSGERYEAGWSVRLKRTGSYDRQVRTLRQLSPRKADFPEKEINSRIPEIIGLDYMQFTRTVMLAQNSFANFLRAKREEKSSLLEKLTGTEIYGRISQKIHEMTKQAEGEVKALEQLVSGILHDRLHEEEKTALEEERSLITVSAENIAGRTETVRRQLQWLDDYDAARTEVTQREAEYVAANKAYMAMNVEETALERYDAVLGVQPLFQEIVVRRGDIEAIKRNEVSVAKQIEELHAQLQHTAMTLESAREQMYNAESTFSARRPAINRGHTICGEIAGLDGQLKRAEEQLLTARRNGEEHTARLQAKKEQLEKTAALLEKSLLRQQALMVHRMMFDKFDLVKDKLNALTAETCRNEEVHKKHAALQKQQTMLKAASEKVEEKLHADEARMTALKSELLIHRQMNQGLDSMQLQQRFADNRNRLLVLQRAKALWQRISSGYEEIEEKEAEVGRLVSRQGQLQKDMERMERELAVLDEAHRRQSVALTLSQSENIKQLRQRLKEGTACPVCGATHHPYHTETERELGELLTNLEKEYEEATAELAEKRATFEAMTREYATRQGRLESERTNLLSRSARQAADVEEWSACAHLDSSFSDCSPSVARDTRRLMIGLLLDNTMRSVKEAEKDLETFNFHQGHINRLNEEISALELQMADNRTHIDDLRTQYKIASAAEEETERVMQLSDRSCGELYADLDQMVTLSGWFTEWKNNADELRLRLTDLFHDWQQTCAAVEEHRNAEVLLREEVKLGENTLSETRRLLSAAQDAHSCVENLMATKRDELARLFGNGSPEQEEHRLQEEVDKARAAETAARAAHEETGGKLRLQQGTQRNLLESRLHSQAEYSRKTAELDTWILRFNGSHSPMQFAELEQIFADTRDWKALRVSLNARKETVTLTANRLQMSRDALQRLRNMTHRPTGEGEESREALTATLESLQAEAENANKRLTHINLRLMAHENCLKQAAAYAGRIETARTDCEEWRRLDSLLGSHDGKKFRELAQSYTFAFLVEHANAQLRMFSPRYELRNVPGRLTLEIIDRDMFDEHRYVSSLSGGETFVVSLALALGLASLSTGSLSIGSLFIDEGFGNLDHASLDLVMTALSNLENAQGRKVGVISHTEQIRSQISPQIHLVKQPAGGRSVIRIR